MLTAIPHTVLLLSYPHGSGGSRPCTLTVLFIELFPLLYSEENITNCLSALH